MSEAFPPDAAPVRRHDFEQHEGGLVTVLVPKFTGTLSRLLLVPLLRTPNIRMHLDAEGSAVWTACDSRTTVRQLAELVQGRFGGTAHEAEARVGRFLRSLAREGSIAIIVPARDDDA